MIDHTDPLECLLVRVIDRAALADTLAQYLVFRGEAAAWEWLERPVSREAMILLTMLGAKALTLRAMRKCEGMSIDEVSRVTNLSRPIVRTALQYLVERGYAAVQDDGLCYVPEAQLPSACRILRARD